MELCFDDVAVAVVVDGEDDGEDAEEEEYFLKFEILVKE